MAFMAVVVGFWNVENLFGPQSVQMAGKSWTKSRYYSKCAGIGKVIACMCDTIGQFPDIVCLSEVDCERTLKDIVWSEPLRKQRYRFVHSDSPDKRGIDCALLYRGRSILRSGAHHLYLPDSTVVPTRDILVVEFDDLVVIVNHHPSKIGASGGTLRGLALTELKRLCDSLGTGRPILAIGDFNDTRSPYTDSLLAPMKELKPENDAPGTIKFQGRWQQIDRAFVSPGTGASLGIMASEALSEPDKKFGGTKPKRTYIGPRWHGGLSDHYPIVVRIIQ